MAHIFLRVLYYFQIFFIYMHNFRGSLLYPEVSPKYNYTCQRFILNWRLILLTYQLLDNLLDELSERVIRVLYPQVMDQLGDNFRIGFTFEYVATLLKQSFHLLVIRHDTCAKGGSFLYHSDNERNFWPLKGRHFPLKFDIF